MSFSFENVGSLRKSFSSRRATDFWTSLQYGEWKIMKPKSFRVKSLSIPSEKIKKKNNKKQWHSRNDLSKTANPTYAVVKQSLFPCKQTWSWNVNILVILRLRLLKTVFTIYKSYTYHFNKIWHHLSKESE